MPTRPTVAALGCLLAFAAAAWAQSDTLTMEQLWRSGRFAEAQQLLDARYGAGDRSAEFLGQAARCAEELHNYVEAAQLWAEAAKALHDDPEQYRGAREQEWRDRWLASGGDAKASWVGAAREEVASLLLSAGMQAGSRQLALELQHVLESIVTGQVQPTAELRAKHPKSTVVLRAAKAELDAIAAAEKPQQRLAAAKQFLTDYPGCYWRHGAYRDWLNAAWQLAAADQLREAAAKYLAAFPDHPDSHGAVSRYFLDADIERDEGLKHAKQSVALYEKQLGTDGSADGLRALGARSRAAAVPPSYMPPGLRAQFTNYLGSRYNLGRYLIAEGQADAALAAMAGVVECQPFTLDEEETLAPFNLIAGQAMQAKGDIKQAYKYYLGALVEGDSRGHSALLAQSGLNAVSAKLSQDEQVELAAQYIPEALRGKMLPVFADVTQAAGLDGRRARRAAWGDVNGDGRADLLLDGSVLLLNGGAQGFSDATQQWALQRGKLGGIFGDIDNDGDLDLYAFAAGQGGDRLYRNEGDHLVDVTALFGSPTDSYESEAAAFLDYDNDGWLDLYVANSPARGIARNAGSATGAPGMLYRNAGGGKYALVQPETCQMTPPFGVPLSGRGVCCADFDNNNSQDIFAGNGLAQENLLWGNAGGGQFNNLARQAGTAGFDDRNSLGITNGSDWGDFDNDGRLDLFCCNLEQDLDGLPSCRSQLLLNTSERSGPQFTDHYSAAGLRYASTLMDAAWLDCNNDGWLDLYLCAAYPGRRSYLYLNDGAGQFHDVTYFAGARLYDTWGVTWADYDADGDLDLLVTSPNGVHLLRNDTPPQDWLEVACLGSTAGANAAAADGTGIGARVTVTTEAGTLTREIQSGKGMGCGNELLAHFGLGRSRGRISIVVRFPSGQTATRALMQARQRLVFSEGEPPGAGSAAAGEAPQSKTPQKDQDAGDRDEELSRPTGGRGH